MKKLCLISIIPALALFLNSCTTEVHEPAPTTTSTTTTTHETTAVTQPPATSTTTIRTPRGGY